MLLLAVHLALGIAPAAMFLVPPNLLWIPLAWALAGVSFGQLMLLAFWAGMGTTTSARRMTGSLLAALYLAVWPSLGLFLSPYADPSATMIASFALYLALNVAMLVMFGGIFLLIRRRFAQLRRLEDPTTIPPGRYQFSILQLLLVTSVVAVVLGLLRWSTSDDRAIWHELASNLLAIVALVVNVVVAPWAALAAGAARWRLLIVMLTAILLGTAMSFSALFQMAASEWRIWLFCTQSLAFTLPSATVVLSLLVVRASGYRMVRLAAQATPREAAEH